MQEPAPVLSPAQSNQSSDKLLGILEVLSEQSEPLHLQGISQLCNVNPSTALRFLASLRRRNYVAQTADTGKYYLTFKICALAQSVRLFSDMRSVALPYLRNAAHLFSESCSLAIDSDMTAMYIEVVPGPNKKLLSLQRLGGTAPLHCTAVGKLLLSEYSPARLERLIAIRRLVACTSTRSPIPVCWRPSWQPFEGAATPSMIRSASMARAVSPHRSATIQVRSVRPSVSAAPPFG